MKIKITLRHRVCLRVDGGAAATTGHVRVTFFSVFGIAPRNRGPRSSLAFYSLLPILREDKQREREEKKRACSIQPTPNRPRSSIHRNIGNSTGAPIAATTYPYIFASRLFRSPSPFRDSIFFLFSKRLEILISSLFLFYFYFHRSEIARDLLKLEQWNRKACLDRYRSNIEFLIIRR